MFSVKSENILLNYFVVLLTLGLYFFYALFFGKDSLSLIFAILFILLLFAGFLLYFDRYFFFKISFVIILFIAILYLVFSSSFSLLILLVLFISLSQLCNLLSYLTLFVFLLLYVDVVEIYLVFAVFIFSLIFTFLFKLRQIQKGIYSRLFLSESKYSLLKHSIGNLCSILFFKNKDDELSPFLEEMRLALQNEKTLLGESETSVAGLFRLIVYFLDYGFNLKIKGNFYLTGKDLFWLCLFYNILEIYAKKGSTIVIQNGIVLIPLKNGAKNELFSFLKRQLVADRVEIRNNVLKLSYGR
jgi:hypothetical protein